MNRFWEQKTNIGYLENRQKSFEVLGMNGELSCTSDREPVIFSRLKILFQEPITAQFLMGKIRIYCSK
jgi:hypothetical protein